MYEIFIDNLNLNNYVVIQKLEGLNVPERKIYLGSYLLNDSGAVINRFYKQRVVAIEGALFGNDEADYFDKREVLIDALGSVVKVFKIKVRNKFYYLYNGKVIYGPVFIETPGEAFVSNFRIELVFEDILIYDDEITSFEIAPLKLHGAPLRMVVNQAFLSNQKKQGVVVSTASDLYQVKYKITGPIANPTITLLPEGVYMVYNGTLNSTDELVISYSYSSKQAFLNSNVDVSANLNDFYSIGFNRNLIVLNGLNHTTNTKLIIEMQGNYLGI